MGKGDKRTARGKRFASSYGKTRTAGPKISVSAVQPAKPVAKKAAAKKAPAKKAAAKSA